MSKLRFFTFLLLCVMSTTYSCHAQKSTTPFSSKTELISQKIQLNPTVFKEVKNDTLAVELLYGAIKDSLDLKFIQTFTDSIYLKKANKKLLAFSIELLRKQPADSWFTVDYSPKKNSTEVSPLKFDNVDKLLKYIDDGIKYIEEKNHLIPYDKEENYTTEQKDMVAKYRATINKYRSYDLATLTEQTRNSYLLAIAKKDFLPIDFKFEAFEIEKYSFKNKMKLDKKSIDGEVFYKITFYKDKEKKLPIKSIKIYEKVAGMFVSYYEPIEK